MSLTADELAAQLRDEILSGELPTGTKLPSINVFVSERGAGRGVVQQALNKLRAEGLIASRHGAGNYVQGGFGRVGLARNGDSAPSEQDREITVVRVDEVPAPDYVADSLKLAPGDIVVMRRSRVDLDGRPAQLDETCYPVAVARGTALVYHDMGAGGAHARLEEQGRRPDRLVERVVARAATAAESEALGLRAGAPPVVEITRTAWSAGVPVEVSRTVLDSQVYEIVYEFQR